MRTGKLLLACLAVAAMILVACKKGEEATPTEPTAPAAATAIAPAPTPTAAPAGGEMTKESYVKIAVELGCLAQKETDRTALTNKTMELFKKYSIDQGGWASVAQKFSTDTAVAMEIAKGVQTCQ